MSALPVPEPRRDPELAAYWEAAAAGRLTVTRCRRCARLTWYPRSHCPACGSLEVEQVPTGGEGVVHSFTVNRRPAGPYKGLDALVLAYVDLAEGPRILTNLVGVEPSDIDVGTAVRAVHDRSPAGAGVLRFAPRS